MLRVSGVEEWLVLVGALTTCLPLLPGIFVVIMANGGSALSLDQTRGRVRLAGRDSFLVAVSTVGVSAAAAGAYLAWLPLGCSAVLAGAGIVPCFGCRFSLDATASGGRLQRRVLWRIPWRTIALARPAAWVDGWGDWADPLAVHVGETSPDGVSCEVAWSSKGDDAEEVVAQFERAVARLRRPRRDQRSVH